MVLAQASSMPIGGVMPNIRDIIQEAQECLTRARTRLAYLRLQGELCIDLEADIKALEADIQIALKRTAA